MTIWCNVERLVGSVSPDILAKIIISFLASMVTSLSLLAELVWVAAQSSECIWGLLFNLMCLFHQILLSMCLFQRILFGCVCCSLWAPPNHDYYRFTSPTRVLGRFFFLQLFFAAFSFCQASFARSENQEPNLRRFPPSQPLPISQSPSNTNNTMNDPNEYYLFMQQRVFTYHRH